LGSMFGMEVLAPGMGYLSTFAGVTPACPRRYPERCDA
jgi:hypothetical protein